MVGLKRLLCEKSFLENLLNFSLSPVNYMWCQKIGEKDVRRHIVAVSFTAMVSNLLC